MKIKISTSPYYYCVLAMIIMDTGYFALLNIPYLSNTNNIRAIILAAGIFLTFNSFVNKHIFNSIKPYTNYYNMFMLYLFLFFVIHTLYGYIHYDQKLLSIINVSSYLGLFLLMYPILFVFIRSNGYEHLMDVATGLTAVFLLIKTLRALAFNLIGIDFLPHLENTIRSGRLRQDLVPVGGVVFVYCLSRLIGENIEKNKRYKYIAVLLLMAFYLFYTNMTRMYIISFALVAIAMILFKSRPKNKQILVIAVMLLLAAAFYFSGLFAQFMETFSPENEELGGSAIARDLSNEYFKNIANENKLFGMGFLSVSGSNYYIFFGPMGTFYLDDLGIRNMYYHYGILGIILVAASLGRMLYITIQLVTHNYSKKLFLVGTVVYIISSSVSLCIYDGQRLFSLILFWAIIEYDYYQYFISSGRQTLSQRLRARQKKADRPAMEGGAEQ